MTKISEGSFNKNFMNFIKNEGVIEIIGGTRGPQVEYRFLKENLYWYLWKSFKRHFIERLAIRYSTREDVPRGTETRFYGYEMKNFEIKKKFRIVGNQELTDPEIRKRFLSLIGREGDNEILKKERFENIPKRTKEEVEGDLNDIFLRELFEVAGWMYPINKKEKWYWEHHTDSLIFKKFRKIEDIFEYILNRDEMVVEEGRRRPNIFKEYIHLWDKKYKEAIKNKEK